MVASLRSRRGQRGCTCRGASMVIVALLHAWMTKRYHGRAVWWAHALVTSSRTTTAARRRTRRLIHYYQQYPLAMTKNKEHNPDIHLATKQSPSLMLPWGGAAAADDDHTTTLVRSVAAPMVAASDYAFRTLCRQYGVDLCFTQMLHARNINRDASFRHNHCDFYECWQPPAADSAEPRRFDTQPDSFPGQDVVLPPLTTVAQEHFLQGLDRVVSGSHSYPAVLTDEKGGESCTNGPLVIQLAGHRVEEVVTAAQWLVEHTQGRVAGIDLNCGCPQQIARKGNYGAFFMEADNGQSAARVLKALRQAVPDHILVSTKCRLPLQAKQLHERVHRLQDAGIDFLTVHGRTLRENKTLTGPSNTQAIRQVVEWMDIPVIANGGVETHDDVQRILQQTGASAVMSSEGLLERPDIFGPPVAANHNDETTSARAILDRQFQFARDYLAWARLFPPLPGVLGQQGGSFNIVRGHLFKFLHRYWQEHTDLRDELASHHRMLGLRDAYDLVDRLEERYTGLKDLDQLASSSMESSWYRRHWKASGVTSTTSARPTEAVPPPLTVPERKALLQTRIANLRAQRKERKVANMLP